ncbi:hypothetical protein HJG60_011681 [Phyllostomus discolor]|uniref:Uncharacterized protein n=1 Tax=Phyllostomus discolor TaxID=89673 RepID=A0A833ZYI4_9CHIR|nr:hypothetical protein HJG60_011681 [Phyllostomus discolor]
MGPRSLWAVGGPRVKSCSRLLWKRGLRGHGGSFQTPEGLSGVSGKELVGAAAGGAGTVTERRLCSEQVEGRAVGVGRTVSLTAQLSGGGTGLSWEGTRPRGHLVRPRVGGAGCEPGCTPRQLRGLLLSVKLSDPASSSAKCSSPQQPLFARVVARMK